MAQTYGQRIVDIVGEALSGSDLDLSNTKINDALTAAKLFIISLAPQSKKYAFCKESSTSDGSGVSVDGSEFLYALRNDGKFTRACRIGNAFKRGAYINIRSIDYASSTFPVAYIKVGKVYIAPDPTSTQQGTVIHPDKSEVQSVSVATPNFPIDLDQALILFASAQIFRIEASLSRRNAYDEIIAAIALIHDGSGTSVFESMLPSALSLSSPPGAPVISYTSAGSTVSTTITPPTAPTFSPLFSFTYDATDFDVAWQKARDLIAHAADTDFESLMDADDIEKAKGYVEGALAETQRAGQNLEEQNLLLRDYSEKLKSDISDYNGRVQQYQSNIQYKIAEISEAVGAYAAKADDNNKDALASLRNYEIKVQEFIADTGAAANEHLANVKTAESIMNKARTRIAAAEHYIKHSSSALEAGNSALKESMALIQAFMGVQFGER